MKIKSILSTSALALLAGFVATNAHADMSIGGITIDPYLGMDYQHSSLDYSDYPATSAGFVSSPAGNYSTFFGDSADGFDAHGGLRIGKYAGLEIGYMDSGTTTKNSSLNFSTPFGPVSFPTSSKISLTGPVFDFMGYLPVTDSGSVELIGTVGISDLTENLSGNIAYLGVNGSQTEVGYRVGGGAQYYLTDNLNARALIRYQSADFSGLMNGAVLFNLGFNYEF